MALATKRQIESRGIILYTIVEMEDYLDYITFLSYRAKYLKSQIAVIDEFFKAREELNDKLINLYDKTNFKNIDEKIWRCGKMERSLVVLRQMAYNKYNINVVHTRVVAELDKFLAEHAMNLEMSRRYHIEGLFVYELPIRTGPSAAKRGRKINPEFLKI